MELVKEKMEELVDSLVQLKAMGGPVKPCSPAILVDREFLSTAAA